MSKRLRASGVTGYHIADETNHEENDMALTEKLRRKMAKLQNMAADTSSEHEAMMAARQLHALLAKHGVDLVDLKEDDEYATDQFDLTHKQLGVWTGYIAAGIAKLYFCHCYQSHSWGTGKDKRITLSITGSPLHRTTAVNMIKSVIEAVDRNSRLASKTDRPTGQDGWSFICSFRHAAAVRISSRCAEMVERGRRGELKDESDGSNLPALAPMYDRESLAVDAFLQGEGLNLGKSKQRASTQNAAGRAAGRQFGSTVGLNESIGSTVNSRLLK